MSTEAKHPPTPALRPQPLEAATAYLRRGWSVIPVPHMSKNPGFPGWEQVRLTVAEAHHHFNGHPQNIGLLCGEPSGWVVDVDLDHPRAVALADGYLPPTAAVFGRPGKPRSHRLYRVSGPVATRKFKSKSAGMIVELRSTGMQTVIPPGTHESGECRARGRSERATCVDHVVPHKGDQRLFWDRSNWQALCATHHGRKTALYDGGFGNAVRTPPADGGVDVGPAG